MFHTSRLAARSSAVALAITLAACGGSNDDDPDAPVPPNTGTGVTQVATGLQAPWSIAFYKGTTLVSERDTARIVVVDANGGLTSVATIAAVDGGGEGGLLGIAVRDDYLYTYLTVGAENRIVRYALTGTGTAVRLGAAQTLLAGIPAANIRHAVRHGRRCRRHQPRAKPVLARRQDPAHDPGRRRAGR
jgi:glucose/arabinose dehydrogenase